MRVAIPGKGKNCKPNLWGKYYPNSKPDNHTTMKENYRLLSLINGDAKILKKFNSSAIDLKDHTTWSCGICSGGAGLLQYMQLNKWDTPHKQKEM